MEFVCFFMFLSFAKNLVIYLELLGARGSVVVKALCYKMEDRGFDSR
jgi:hypothetical protein